MNRLQTALLLATFAMSATTLALVVRQGRMQRTVPAVVRSDLPPGSPTWMKQGMGAAPTSTAPTDPRVVPIRAGAMKPGAPPATGATPPHGPIVPLPSPMSPPYGGPRAAPMAAPPPAPAH